MNRRARIVAPLSVLLAFFSQAALAETAEVPPRAVDTASQGKDSEELARRLADRVGRVSGLTSEKAARLALATSTEARARSADVEVADSEVKRATVGYYPRLSLVARYTRLSSIVQPPILPGSNIAFPVILDQYMAQAGVVVPLSDYVLRIGQSYAAASRSREAAEAWRDAARRTVASNVKLQYYGWARTRLSQAVTEQSVAQARHHLELARAAHETGRMPQAEVLRAESLLASAELLDERTKNAAEVAEDRLRTLLHDDRAAPYQIGEDLLAPLPGGEQLDADALLVEALRERPELRASSRNRESLLEQRKAAAATGLPRLDGFGNAYLGNPNPRYLPPQEQWKATWDLGVQLTWSPNDLGGSDATARSLEAKARRSAAEHAALVDAVRDEISAAVIATREARFALHTAEHGLASAEEAYRVRRDLFELGRGTHVELIDAESDVLRARLEMIQARVDARMARVRLDHATGRDRIR